MNKTEIINNALLFLSEPPINNLNEDSKIAKTVLSVYDLCVKELFDSLPCDFAYRYIKLNKANKLDSMGRDIPYDENFRFIYILPPDCTYLRAVDHNDFLKNFRNEKYNADAQADYRIIAEPPVHQEKNRQSLLLPKHPKTHQHLTPSNAD